MKAISRRYYMIVKLNEGGWRLYVGRHDERIRIRDYKTLFEALSILQTLCIELEGDFEKQIAA